ncbi:MAG: alkaline phosphatase family protein [Kofleriaceae bacterium]|nr:alkaline phosphatase family protein [Kofleriaceae bacterium]
MRRATAVLICLLALASCPRPPATPATPATPARPRLVVLIVIDQLPTWAFERDRALFKGGLARLLRDGGYVRAAELPYANTFTAPGHATISTGTTPSVHGVIGNQWFRRDVGKDLSAEHDSASPVLSVGEPVEDAQRTDTASAQALRVEGLAEALRRATNGKGHSLAIGLKSRAAVFLAGQHPDLAVFYDAGAGGMTTSTAYAKTAPPWLVAHAHDHPVKGFIGQSWQPLDPALLARHTGLPDNAPGEGDIHGLGVSFPHVIRDAEALVQTPLGDDLVLDTAMAALTPMQLGTDDVPDLLALSLNAHDYCGHNWGPDSWEILDLTLRLDAALGKLFAELDVKYGKSGWAVVLTSDHGATPVVERSPHPGARRIPSREIIEAIDNTSIDALPGTESRVARVSSNQVYLSERMLQLPPQRKGPALDAARERVSKIAGVEGVFRTDLVAGDCARLQGLAQLVCNAVMPGVSGELYVAPVRGSLLTDYTAGTHHDAPNDDNRLVPILVMAPGMKPQQQARGSLLQVAPTVAALLGIAPPAQATAPPLFGLKPR